MKQRITKIIHRAIRPNQDGKWMVWCQVYINGNFRYASFDFDTYEEASKLTEGQIVDLD